MGGERLRVMAKSGMGMGASTPSFRKAIRPRIHPVRTNRLSGILQLFPGILQVPGDLELRSRSPDRTGDLRRQKLTVIVRLSRHDQYEDPM